MIYHINQVSNRDTQVLYFYRILRHDASEISAIYRYDNPEVFILTEPSEVIINDTRYFEYKLQCKEISNRIPYLEFYSDDEAALKQVESLEELEVTADNLIIRSTRLLPNSKISVSVYWVPSFSYIQQLQIKVEKSLNELKNKSIGIAEKAKNTNPISDYDIQVDALPPNLVNIGTDGTELIYSDSLYRLSGSLAEQTLINASQQTISNLIKSQVGVLDIQDLTNSSMVYQGFYGGQINLAGNFRTLVLKDIASIVFLDKLTADRVLIENCTAVIFRKELDEPGYSRTIGRLDIRNSYVTIYQPIAIDEIWCYRNSTTILKQGKIGTIGFIEAGSSLVFDTPSLDCDIEEIHLTRIQGLFYTKNPPETLDYLDEIYYSQKPISFQRGQIDDPLPISKANVTIYLKKAEPGPTPPGPTPGDKIYSPFTDWYWSGDSRTAQLIAQTHTDGKGYVGEALSKLIQVQTEIETEGTQHNIMLWWGVNGLYSGASNYADVYKSIANTVASNAMVFVGTVGHCPDGTGSGRVDGGGGQPIGPFNEEIAQFNSDLVQALSNVSNIHLLDIHSYIKSLESARGAAWLTTDNLHYTPQASQMIYDWVCDQITNIDPGTIPDAPTTTNAGRIWNWFKYANIPNVSNRPELIAGIIGNCQQESYSNIDLLGNNGTYYGPWCESQVDFRDTVTAAGFSFHPYTTTPGDDSAAIPTIFNWLTQQSSSWVNWLITVIDQVSSKTGEAGARAYAELFCVCVERCVGGADAVLDPGVYQIMLDEYGGTVYTYQDLGNRRDNAASIYRQFMGG